MPRSATTGLLIAVALLTCFSTVPAQKYGLNDIQKGEWRYKRNYPEGWVQFKSGYYMFQTNAPRDRIDVLAKHMNKIYRLYSKSFPSSRAPKRAFVVKVFKDRQGFLEYGSPPGAGAYYSWSDKEMVGYDTGKLDGKMTEGGVTGEESPLTKASSILRKRQTMDMLGVFAHEGWHQYFHHICPSKVDFPSWCDEGIGEYFYTARFKGRKAETGAPNDYRLGTIRAAIKKDTHIPLKNLVTFNQRQYYAQAGLAYAEGWSFVHFLQEHPDYKKKRYLKNFVKTFIDRHDIQAAVKDVFGRVDWKKVEEDWKKWVMDMPYDTAEEIRRKALEKELKGDPEAPAPDPDKKGKNPAPKGKGHSGAL